MLTKTSELAIQTLMYLGLQAGSTPVSPARIAEQLGASPSYMAKVTGLLVKADIVRALRGAHGGVTLSRQPEAISLRAIVEACQGQILGDYCCETSQLRHTCGFHQAMSDLHEAIVGTLGQWTLADLLAKAGPSGPLKGIDNCRMARVRPDDK